MAAIVSDILLAWYDRHARDLSWRARPGAPAPDPYHVYLSEIMLQQTTVAAVKPYFAAFTARWPTIEALAAASDEDVMAAWAGLGYYSRARNMVRATRVIAALGDFPRTEAELRTLPGIGAYSAASIAAIAFGQRAVVVDANVERVVARLFNLTDPLPGVRKAIRVHADAITPAERAGDFAQAMMDLGATICTPREPKCLLCPLAPVCEARAHGDPARLPVKPQKRDKPVRTGNAYWIERAGAVWLVQRPGVGLLAGMRALPDDGWSARKEGDGIAPLKGSWTPIGMVSHTFTHFKLELSVHRCETRDTPQGRGQWWPTDQLDEAGLPTLFRNAARLAQA